MSRLPRETYISPQRNGYPNHPTAVMRRRRMVAIVIATFVAAAIAAGVTLSLMAGAANLPGVVKVSGIPGVGAETADGETGSIDITAPISPFESEHPAVSRLDPAVREAIQAAAADAEADGIELLLTSGWRSADYQAGLLQDAIADYGSESAAREFVSTPEGSKHVTGEAVDIARVDPALWLEQYGAQYGLCRAFVNESWHFELLTEPGGVCPEMLADASETA